MRATLGMVAAIASLGLALPSQAQLLGRQRAAPAPASPQVDCAALARMPNAPMTPQACEAMMSQAGAMQAAMNAPGGERPGDGTMSCEAIKAEMATQQGVGVSREHVAEGQAAAEDYKATSQRVNAEGAAMAAQQTATSAAAASVSFIPGVGGAAATAAGKANEASSRAFSARAAAELNPAQQRLFEATNASLGDVTRSMQDNPRFARLVRLAQEKDCR